MSESKMREALERLVAVVVKRNCDGMEWGDNFGELMTALGVSHAALAQPAAVVELTDEEIESVAHRSCSIYVHGRDQIYHRYEFGRLTIFDFATKLIQTYRAKQGGAA